MSTRQRRVAIATAALICAGSAFGPVVARADTTSTFYVSNATSANCSDSTTNSAATPYCTIQAAVDVATTAGDTVIVSPGEYAPFTVTASGTAAAPITIETTSGRGFDTSPYTDITTTSDTGAVTLDGASHVVIKGLSLEEEGDAGVITVTRSPRP